MLIDQRSRIAMLHILHADQHCALHLVDQIAELVANADIAGELGQVPVESAVVADEDAQLGARLDSLDDELGMADRREVKA
jgi:hypothetical protein